MAYGEGSLGEVALGESIVAGQAIIPEITFDTKQLVLVVEIDMIVPGGEGILLPPPEPLLPFAADDTYTVVEGTTVELSVLDNDSNLPNEPPPGGGGGGGNGGGDI